MHHPEKAKIKNTILILSLLLSTISRQNYSHKERRLSLMSKKGENIYKRKDGRWEGRYIKSRTNNGKIVYGYVYAKTYRETKIKLLESKSSIITQPVLETILNPNKFSTVALDWFKSIKSQTKESTQNKYFNMLTHYILPSYGERTLDSITYDFIKSSCNRLLISGGKNGKGLSTKTVMDVLSIIRNILKFAIKKGMYVPCDGSSIQVKHTAVPMRVLSKTEQEQLCKYILAEPEPCNIGILVCLFTGLRIGEICALRWEDISFADQIIYIHHTLQRIQNQANDERKTKIVITTPKSSCSIRTIPIPDELSIILATYQRKSVGYLLTNDDNKFMEPRTMQNRFKKVLKLSGIEAINFHALRHTFATRCIELDFDIKSLSEILGHSTVNITLNRYVHPTLELKKDNMNKLSSLLAVK